MKTREIMLSVDIDGTIIGVVPLTQNQHSTVSIEDVEYIGKYNWNAIYSKSIKNYYATTNVKTERKFKMVQMHRKILERKIGKKLKKNEVPDHIDRNPLNNCRGNLRVVTRRQNSQNKGRIKTSDFPGISYQKTSKKWRAQINLKKKPVHICLYPTKKSAAIAYEMAHRLFFKKNLVCKIDKRASYFINNKFTPIWKIRKNSLTSQYKGIHYSKGKNKWVSTIMIDKKSKHLGQFNTEIEAYDARYEFLKGMKNEKN